MKLVEALKALADENRMAIMCFLHDGPRCVCEIEQVLSISQSSASKHLNKLRQASLIVADKKAQWVHYRIRPEAYQEYPFLEGLIENARGRYTVDTSKICKPPGC